MDLEKLRERLAALNEEGKAIYQAAHDDGQRDLTEEEANRVDELTAEIHRVNAQIDRASAFNAAVLAGNESVGRRVQPLRDEGEAARRAERNENQWASMGEFAHAVFDAARPGGRIDPRLHIEAAPTTYGTEDVGSDGGFLVPQQFSEQIRAIALGAEAFLPMTDNYPVGGNSLSFPKDETTPWGSTGIQAYWVAEAAQGTESKPVVDRHTLTLHKLMCLVPMSDELLEDTSALTTYITRKCGEAIMWKTNDSLVNGKGAGLPLGIYNAPALISQAKETSQTADTIMAANVAKMFGRMPAASVSRAVWLIANDAFNQLITMTVGDSPIWTPPIAGMQDAPAGRLLGRPVYMSQTCQTLGDLGDIYFVDWPSYVTIGKTAGLQMATSIHLYFDYAITSFRAVFRVDGRPWLQSAISPAYGSTTLSPFVTLAART